MELPYTTGDLVRLVTNLQTDVNQILALIVCGSRVTTDAPAMAADMIFITKTMSALSTRLQTQVSDMRREAAHYPYSSCHGSDSSSTPQFSISSSGKDLTHQPDGVALCAASCPGLVGGAC